MEMIYVLLRQEKQTGPYSLAELIQFDLKPYDLIWIEGQSAGWYYPQEIAALHPYLPFLPQQQKPVAAAPAAEKNVFVQAPVVSEALKTVPVKREPPEALVEAWQPPKVSSPDLEAAVFAQFAESVAAKEISFAPVIPSVHKRKSPNPALVSATIILIVGSVFAASWLLNRGTVTEDDATEVVTDTATPNEMATMAVAANDNTNSEKSKALPKQKEAKKSRASIRAVAPANQDPHTKKETFRSTDVVVKDRTPAPVSENENAQLEEKAPAEMPSAPQEKKKSLKEKIADLFRKKPAESKPEERRPAETENGERVATRRESSVDLAQMVHVRFDVPNDWMMGIKGAKATMVNRGSQKITSATIEVLYYNDDNELLQKKTVSFGRIDAKESKTIAIPDHTTATKVDYQVVSVTGQPAA